MLWEVEIEERVPMTNTYLVETETEEDAREAVLQKNIPIIERISSFEEEGEVIGIVSVKEHKQ